MTDERKREEQPKSSDETSLSVKNDTLLPEMIDWIFYVPCDFNVGKGTMTLVLAYQRTMNLESFLEIYFHLIVPQPWQT